MATLALFCVLLSVTSLVRGQQLDFVLLGDWGGQSDAPYTTPIELQVAQQMGITAEQVNAKFVVAIGDNFYSTGIQGDAHNQRFKATFENVFTAPSLQKRWFVVAGNHDHEGNVTAQTEYTNLSDRWYFPSEWYHVTVGIPKTNATVEFIFIDTVVYDEWWNPYSYEESSWIEKRLQSSTADWIFVVGHFPIWSVAEHGPTNSLVKDLLPLLQQYGAAIYFSGHDHDLQHLNDGSSVDFVVTGAGHSSEHSMKHAKDVPSESLKYFYPTNSTDIGHHGGFVAVNVTPDEVTVTYINDLGENLYNFTKPNPRKMKLFAQ